MIYLGKEKLVDIPQGCVLQKCVLFPSIWAQIASSPVVLVLKAGYYRLCRDLRPCASIIRYSHRKLCCGKKCTSDFSISPIGNNCMCEPLVPVPLTLVFVVMTAFHVFVASTNNHRRILSSFLLIFFFISIMLIKNPTCRGDCVRWCECRCGRRGCQPGTLSHIYKILQVLGHWPFRLTYFCVWIWVGGMHFGNRKLRDRKRHSARKHFRNEVSCLVVS